MLITIPSIILAISLLLIRVIVGIIFIDSGRRDLQDPKGRSENIGMSKVFVIFLGTAEVLGGIAVIFGILTQFASLGLMLIMLGAIYRKAFVWKTGFWGKSKMGWHYDLMLFCMNFVILTTAGGVLVLWR